jgi:hypothetical protein
VGPYNPSLAALARILIDPRPTRAIATSEVLSADQSSRDDTPTQVMAELLAMIEATGLLPTKLKNGGGPDQCHTAGDGEPERLIVVSKPSRNCLLSIDFAVTTALGFSAAAIIGSRLHRHGPQIWPTLNWRSRLPETLRAVPLPAQCQLPSGETGKIRSSALDSQRLATEHPGRV